MKRNAPQPLISADEYCIMRPPLMSLAVPISPPLRPLTKLPRTLSYPGGPQTQNIAVVANSQTAPSLAAIEAGEAKIKDHLEFFSEHFATVTRSSAPGPRLSNADFGGLYQRNQHEHGHHFVIHQHDHPVAGVHYDLRLQISKSSSISFAIIYGLPGNPNSMRLSRNATETRVHNLWNHLIESASLLTGSLLIWDTGEYFVLPHRPPRKETDDELSSESEDNDIHGRTSLSESAKLHEAFQSRKIRLRLHGTRLPPNYTITFRLHDTNNRHEQPKKPTRKRWRKDPNGKARGRKETPPSSDLEEELLSLANDRATPDAATPPVSEAFDRELQELEDEGVRLTNAYPSASNTINSIYQRQWCIMLDRSSSGFVLKRDTELGSKMWVRKKGEGGESLGFEPFFVRGRDVERSVVTGRTADEVMADEGVKGFVGRKGWRAVLE